MSYILDALKKADAERERSPVPGLNAHDGGFGIADRRDGPPWRAIAIGTVVVLAAVLAWLVWGRADSAPPSAPPQPMPVTDARPAGVGAVPSPAPVPVAAPAPTPVPLPLADGSTPMPPPVMSRPAPAPTRSPAAAGGVPRPPPVAQRAEAAPPEPAARPAAQAQAPQRAPAPVPAAPAGTRVPTRNELPADLRAALPAINVSGAVYAPQPASRLLFANGLVLREGDAVADGLTVERIGASSSVLVFRGQRFELPH